MDPPARQPLPVQHVRDGLLTMAVLLLTIVTWALGIALAAGVVWVLSLIPADLDYQLRRRERLDKGNGVDLGHRSCARRAIHRLLHPDFSPIERLGETK